MGWIPSWLSSSSSSETHTNDPLSSLDPSLKAFLEKESPVKYTTPPPPPSPPPVPEPTNAPQPAHTTATATTERNANNVPPESLYQDGRYAHLWSTYRSRGEVESTMKSDQEKLMDIIDGFKSRKAMIGKAALENCALEQGALSDCYLTGSWGQTMTMCRQENGAFTRCYTMQARFLKALGYLSTHDRPPEIDEKIQMHADKLYHRMLAQERATEEAKAAGLPAPVFDALVPSASASPELQPTTAGQQQQPQKRVASLLSHGTGPDTSSDSVLSIEESTTEYLKRVQPRLRDQFRKEWDKRGLSPQERMLEARAVAMEAEAGVGVADQVGQMVQHTQRGREERRAKGDATLGDRISGIFGW
ncbi:MAG: hypothetical protein Q9220_001575 [cf. Caloplaca sp. 1 TL-2023]